MKKVFFFFIFCFAIIFGLAVNVRAIGCSNTIKGTIDTESYLITDTVGVDINDTGNTLQFYKIIDSFYNSNTNVVTYEFTSQFKSFLASTAGNSNDYSTLSINDYIELAGATEEELSQGSTTLVNELSTIASLYAKYIREEGILATYDYSGSSISVEVGSYLIFSKQSYSKIYAVMVANAQYKSRGTDWILEDVSIVPKSSEVGGICYVDTEGNFQSTHAIGDIFTYIAKVTVPIYPTNATSKSFIFRSVFDEGIELSESLSSVIFSSSSQNFINDGTGQILDYDTKKVVATITYIDNVLTCSLFTENIVDRSLTITLNSKLNNKAVIGKGGNIANFYYTYSNDPYGDGTSFAEVKAENIHKVYTYGLKVSYTDKEDATKYLIGSVFKVYRSDDNDFSSPLGILTIGEDGSARLDGIVPGTYVLKQISTAAGYVLNSPIEFTFTSNDVDEEGYYNMAVTGNKFSLLPSTGGLGTIMFTIIGILLVVLAIVFLIFYNKTKRKKNR